MDTYTGYEYDKHIGYGFLNEYSGVYNVYFDKRKNEAYLCNGSRKYIFELNESHLKHIQNDHKILVNANSLTYSLINDNFCSNVTIQFLL